MQEENIEKFEFIDENSIKMLEDVIFSSEIFKSGNFQLKSLKHLFYFVTKNKYKFYILLNIKKHLFSQTVSNEKIMQEIIKDLVNLDYFYDIYLYYTINLLLIEIKLNGKVFNFNSFNFVNSSDFIEKIQKSEIEAINIFENVLEELNEFIAQTKAISLLILRKSYIELIGIANGKNLFIKKNFFQALYLKN